MIKAEKNIPIPRGKQGVRKYPFDTMNIGDSFLYKDHADDMIIACQRIGAIASTWVRRNNSKKKFSCRRTKTGIRVWRML